MYKVKIFLQQVVMQLLLTLSFSSSHNITHVRTMYERYHHMKTESTYIFTQLHSGFVHTELCKRMCRRTLFVQHPFIPWTHFCDRQHDIQLSTFQSFAFKISSPRTYPHFHSRPHFILHHSISNANHFNRNLTLFC